METTKVLVFGTFSIPFFNERNDATFTAPSLLTEEMIGGLHFDDLKSQFLIGSQNIEKGEEDNEVTHGFFWGENIKRLMKTLKKE